MPDDEVRQVNRDAWSGAAEEWARRAEEPDSGASAAAAEWMLETAALQPGERVLEVACGAGRIGLRAAEQVGDGGRVICTDFAEQMVEATQRRIEMHGITNAEARVLDAEEMEFADQDRFDAVLCRFGYMLMGDPEEALRRTRSSLRSDGRLVLAVWGEAEANPAMNLVFEAVMEKLNAPPPAPGTPGPFALADPDRLSAMLARCGFADSRVEVIPATQDYESPAAWFDRLRAVGGPLSGLFGALPPETVAEIREAALASGRRFERPDGGISFPAQVVGALSR